MPIHSRKVVFKFCSPGIYTEKKIDWREHCGWEPRVLKGRQMDGKQGLWGITEGIKNGWDDTKEWAEEVTTVHSRQCYGNVCEQNVWQGLELKNNCTTSSSEDAAADSEREMESPPQPTPDVPDKPEALIQEELVVKVPQKPKDIALLTSYSEETNSEALLEPKCPCSIGINNSYSRLGPYKWRGPFHWSWLLRFYFICFIYYICILPHIWRTQGG